jgi:Radical SAM superfamily/Iron-sulfur cluster-binding domain
MGQPLPARRLALHQLLWRKVVRRVFKNPRRYVYAQDVVYSELPKDVGAEIINICNADCSFCGYGKGGDGKAADPRRKAKLDRSVLRHLVKLYSEAGGGHFSLSPILGEVTAHPDWLELVGEIRSYPNIKGVSCYTNGILLDRFGFTEILQSGITAMTISSSFGSAEQYRRLYGVDKYQQIVDNVLRLLKENKRLGEPVYISLSLKFDIPKERFFESPLYTELMEYLTPERIEILEDCWDDFHGVIKQDGIPFGQKFRENVEDKSAPCSALFRKLQVTLDGTIQACACRVEPELWGGNITKYETLRAAWRDPGLEKIRADWFDGRIPNCCQGCTHYLPYTHSIKSSRPSAVIAYVSRALVTKCRRAFR